MISAMIAAARKIDAARTGYDQSERWSFYTRPTKTIHAGKEADCSSLCGAIAHLGGYPVDLSGEFYTGTFKARLTAAGFTAIPFMSLAQLRAGDFVLTPGYHVEFVPAPGRMFSARSDERGRATGGKAGDQTGREVCEIPAYTYSKGWKWILRPPAPPAPADLRVGATGTRVRALQEGLRQVFPAYRNAVAVQRGRLIHTDGSFGAQTEAWVIEFQKRSGLVPDGVVGPKTTAALAAYSIQL